jgi:hypothetical protein
MGVEPRAGCSVVGVMTGHIGIDIEQELSTEAAPRFARAGMSIFPVDMRPGPDGRPLKTPPYGYAWKQRATSVMNEVVEDFVAAEHDLGIGNVGIAWALGIDGEWAADLDGAEPEWWGELGDTAINLTSRGRRHQIYTMPPGRRISNSTSHFPSEGWGEVRGAGGYIVIWWPGDRPGFDVLQLENIVECRHPEWLTDAANVDEKGCTPAELTAFKNVHTTGKLGRIKGFETKLAAREPGTSRNFHATEVACWIAKEAAADLVPAKVAFDALEDWWSGLGPELDTAGKLKTRTLTRSEILRIERYAIGQLTEARVEEVRAKAEAEQAAWEAEQEEEREALYAMFEGADDQAPPSDNGSRSAGSDHDPLVLADRFWKRTNHAVIRDAALKIGVSPESLMLAVLIAVASHIPPAIVFPGKRRGVPNLLGSIVGPPGGGKGTTLDRALELVPPPTFTRLFKPGTAQGLVKQFYESQLSDPTDPKSPKILSRHEHPVILRVDEIGKFTSATSGDRGQNLISEMKSAVFGEGLGQTVATDEKNLQCEPLSYRLVGLLGVAPGIVAGKLFDDIDDGLPQRLLFANLLRPDQKLTEILDPFENMAEDDTEAATGGQYVALDPLAWNPPSAAMRFSFVDSTEVAKQIAKMLGVRWDLIDAHVPYLTHAVATVLAYFDGRWLIQPADLTLACDVVAMSRAARTQFQDQLVRSKKAEKKERRDEAIATARDTTRVTQQAAIDVVRLDRARGIVARVREWTAEKGRPPTVRDLARNVSDEEVWHSAYRLALKLGWLREERQQTRSGGSKRRAIIVTAKAP